MGKPSVQILHSRLAGIAEELATFLDGYARSPSLCQGRPALIVESLVGAADELKRVKDLSDTQLISEKLQEITLRLEWVIGRRSGSLG